MEDDLDLQQEEPNEYQTMFPGYHNHVYKSACSHELPPRDILPGPPCHSPLR